MTLTEWKRKFQVGTQFKQIWAHYSGEVSHTFTVTQLQTNGMWLVSPTFAEGKRVWMDFPRRSDIIFTQQGWIRMLGQRKLTENVWVEGEQKEN